MDKQLFLDKFKELGTCEDDVQRRDILASLTDDISVLYSDIESDRSTIDVLNQTIEKVFVPCEHNTLTYFILPPIWRRGSTSTFATVKTQSLL